MPQAPICTPSDQDSNQPGISHVKEVCSQLHPQFQDPCLISYTLSLLYPICPALSPLFVPIIPAPSPVLSLLLPVVAHPVLPLPSSHHRHPTFPNPISFHIPRYQPLSLHRLTLTPLSPFVFTLHQPLPSFPPSKLPASLERDRSKTSRRASTL